MRKLICHILVAAVMFQSVMVPAARAASVVSGSMTVAESRANLGESECDIAYASCMDQFCITDNVNAGRCQCHNDFARHDAQWQELEKAEAELLNNTTRALDEIETNARAAVLNLTLESETPAAARTQAPAQSRAAAARAAALALFEEPVAAPDTSGDVATQTGAEKLAAADKICAPLLPGNCDLTMTRMIYSQSIRSDCRAYELTVQERRDKGVQQQRLADSSIREAALTAFTTANRLNSSDCLVELTECMRTDAVCGRTWANCFDGRLAQNRDKCEHILNQCTSVRDTVWNNFVAINTPNIEMAQSVANSGQRQSCLREVSDCIGRACADTIGTDEVSYASCMVNPDAIRTRCRVELDRCSGIPGIFDLAARRWASKQIDACQDEVRACFTHDSACGPDWLRCIGLDLRAMHRMCPVEKLVVCRQNNPNFALSDIDDIVTGIYLAMDNAALDKCNEVVDAKMMEICDELSGCTRFHRMDNFGTESVRREKLADMESITGLVSWSLVGISDGQEWSDCISRGRRNCDQMTKPGTLLIDEYMREFDRVNRGMPGIASFRERVRSELETVQRDISNVQREFEMDPTVNQCIGGRDLSQVTGRTGDASSGRFPLMTNGYRMAIAQSALNRAAENHARRVAALREEIIRESDIMIAEFQCYAIPFQLANSLQQTQLQERTQQLAIPNSVLTISEEPFRAAVTVTGNSITRADIAELAGRREQNEFGNRDLSIRYEMTAIFSQDTRICRVCADTTICGSKAMRANVNRGAASGGVVGAGALAVGTSMVVASSTAATAAAAATAATAATATAATATAAAAAAAGTAGAAAATATAAAATTAATAATATATTTAATAATASAAVPVVGWIAAAVILVGLAYIKWGINDRAMDFGCDTETKCDDVQM